MKSIQRGFQFNFKSRQKIQNLPLFKYCVLRGSFYISMNITHIKHTNYHEIPKHLLLSFIHHCLLEDSRSESQPVHGDLDCREGVGIVGLLLRLILEGTLAQDAKKRHFKKKMYPESIRYLKLCISPNQKIIMVPVKVK
jgi:hypothetical protein